MRAFLLVEIEGNAAFVVGVKDEIKVSESSGQTQRAGWVDPRHAQVAKADFPARLISDSGVDISRFPEYESGVSRCSIPP